MLKLNQQTQDALAAYRGTANLVHSKGLIQFYVSDMVVDAQTIIENEGTPFMVGFGDKGTHLVMLDRPDFDTAIDNIKRHYPNVEWYVWDGSFGIVCELKRVIKTGLRWAVI